LARVSVEVAAATSKRTGDAVDPTTVKVDGARTLTEEEFAAAEATGQPSSSNVSRL
jgi:hypothetical protein